jgi:hypothetical protein
MQLLDGQPVFSATDLVGFLACEHLTALELAGAARLVERPIRTASRIGPAKPIGCILLTPRSATPTLRP